MIPCDKCRAPAVIYQKYSGMHLCSAHFDQDLVRKVRETLRRYRIFGKGGLVAVAVSGGKDSSALLYILKNLFSKRRDIELVALLVDEGIAGYREETLRAAREVAERLEVPHRTLSFQESLGITTDQVAALDTAQAPCTYCGVFRKSILNRAAREMGALALATGHNLDDEVQTAMLNYLRGDVLRLFRLQPRRPLEGMVPRIKPLRRVPEREVALFAITHGLFPGRSGSCPNVPRAMRLEVKQMINDMEARHPGTKYAIMKGFEQIMELRPESSFQATLCQRCGEPTGNEICQSCRLLEQLSGGKAFKSK
ncbi:MAG: TIGR00269 family protein [Methanosarcinales archaeon]|nr:TIGR00269 family protein [Methanosarcinales archaeon]